ncbi:MAG: RnfH family protein [Gammaproteobacteria bacterium]|nr:RnfH family protein [Gammaproteobacteria bacterium]MBT3694642.1 RnfH family protein [Gammaproteobacteria bacterium]MBT5334383.1 RnfH family protein [Gammaproteobacteria bacterium]MBT6025881.1 RnfH family protein [Gammaproteobacteria bacterium]MDB9797056.1 RnfH family protein [Pseudomonadales bacterium]
MLIEMVYADPHDQRHIELEVAEGSNVAACLALLRLHPMGKDLAIDDLAVGVFGEACGPDRVLKGGDRVEFYRPLIADAKTARRLRAKAQG